MRKYAKAGLAALIAGVMLVGNTTFAFAAPDEPILISDSPVSTGGPGSDAAVAPADESRTSGVIVAGQSRVQQETGGPGGSSNVITAPQETEAPAETTAPAETQAPEGTGAPEGTLTPEGTETPEGTLVPEGTELPPEEAAGTGELTAEQAAQLAAEQAAAEAAAAANATNNPLVVPDREPRLQSTILLNDAKAWSQPFVNDQEVFGEGQSFSSVSTFLENIHGNVLYRTYSAANGWSDWAMNGQQTAHASTFIPVEAIQYRFAGPVASKYDIYYSTILSDGTRTGWAKNGETAGTMNTGLYMTGFRLAFFVKGTADGIDTSNLLVSAHADGIQYIDGAMRYIHGDGSNYTGWGWLGNDRYYFVDSVPVTGWQYIDGYKYYFQEDGKMLSDVEPIIGNGGPFIIKINKEMNCMTIYAKDGDNGFIIPVKSFLTSVGDDTPIGTFKTPEKYRWRLMIHDVYTQYATRLGAGLPILMHSIIYDAPNPYTVWASTYNNMGIARSAGCIRLVTGDSKWVYDNCPLGTSVTVYNSPVPGPFERPTIAYEIPFEQTWDPTDPNVTAEGIAAESARIIAKFN